MPRKTHKRNIHDFTRQIHSTVRSGTKLANIKNWNEVKAKFENKLSCKDCRFFWLDGCGEYIGKYHMPCDEFEWD